MFNYHEYIFLIHILFVGPLYIYVGYMKNKTPNMLFNIMLVLGIVVMLYHLYKLYKSLSYKNKTKVI